MERSLHWALKQEESVLQVNSFAEMDRLEEKFNVNNNLALRSRNIPHLLKCRLKVQRICKAATHQSTRNKA